VSTTDLTTYPIRQLLSGAFSLTHRMAYASREKDVGKHEDLRAQRELIVEEIERRCT
jgi:hypothetical protein